MKSKRQGKYGVINERSNPFEDVIYAGEVIFSYYEEEGDRKVIVVRDSEGCLHETYEEFLLLDSNSVDTIVNMIKNKLNNNKNRMDSLEASISCNYTYFNKNKNNMNPPIDKLLLASNTFQKAVKKYNELSAENDILIMSLQNIATVVDKLN